MTTSSQDRDFRDEIFGTEKLEVAIDWISTNMSPADVFDEELLQAWAEENGYVKAGDD